MQRYRPVSDIHSELWPENFYRAGKTIDRLVPPLAEDGDTVLLLAGDIGSYRRRNVYKAAIDRLCDRFRAVVDIPGNHFWYGGTPIEVETAPATRDNYVFGSTARAFNVVAATLWADFWGGDPAVEQHCIEGMNDFRQIAGLTVEGVRERHAAQLQFLRDNILPGSVVMTHFAPSRWSIPEAEREDLINGYYASDLEPLIEETKPAVWVHGHLDEASDYRIGETRVVCNPAGYEGRQHKPRLTFDL